LIRKTKVILIDEATANIDEIAEAIITEVFENEFKNNTVISIAHKLNTILKFDKIVVVNNGEIVESGNP
jgi:ABC-type multidrug transport system fused ATPase/permease subunit